MYPDSIKVSIQPVRGKPGGLLILFFISLLALSPAQADQCEYFNGDTVELVQNVIKTGDILLNYCEPCEMQEPLPLRVRKFRVDKVPHSPKSININGVWYSSAEIMSGRVPDMTKEERDFILESIALANPTEYQLIINGESRDLAYLYYRESPDGITYNNLGMAAGCADGVSPTITYRFPDKSQAPQPPSGPHFEDITGICFDGSCLLDTWTLSTEAVLYAEHYGHADIVATLAPGETLFRERLVSEVTPVLARVVFDHGRFLEGNEFYVLNSIGEGFHRVWYYGRIIEEDLWGVNMKNTDNGEWVKCVKPDANCWAEANSYPDETWWAQVRTTYGKQGWLRDPASVIENIYELE